MGGGGGGGTGRRSQQKMFPDKIFFIHFWVNVPLIVKFSVTDFVYFSKS